MSIISLSLLLVGRYDKNIQTCVRAILTATRTAAKANTKHLGAVENVFYLCDRNDGMDERAKARGERER